MADYFTSIKYNGKCGLCLESDLPIDKYKHYQYHVLMCSPDYLSKPVLFTAFTQY